MSSRQLSVGVVIPARNAADYIGEAIESVLSQGDLVTELVVVDDGSEDETPAAAARLGNGRVRVLHQEQLGPAAARNHGARSLSTDLLAFLDADDLWTAESLRRRMELMGSTSADAAFGLMEQFVSERLSEEERKRLHYDPRPQPGWASGAMLVRRKAFQEIGPFPEHRRGGDFIEWFLAARRGGLRTVMVDVVVLRRRLHDRNISRTEPAINSDYLSIVRAELARRRGQTGGDGDRERRG